MASEIEICNLALSNIRGGSINSFTEGSHPAQQCALKYDILRDRCLREIPWQFNRSIKALASLPIDIFNYAYAYSYPTDCLKIHRMMGEYEKIEAGSVDRVSRYRDPEVLSLKDARRQVPYEVFTIDGVKMIGADECNLYIDYVAKVEDPNAFSADFILALSHLLAAEIAVPIVGAELGRALRRDSLGLYDGYMKSAMASDQNDEYTIPRESDFVTIRN